MFKKNAVKTLVIIVVVLFILILVHVIGGNIMGMVKNHFGL